MDFIEQLVADARAQGLDFLLIGGNALRLHGYLRNTPDVNFLVASDDYPAWRGFLEALW